MSIEVPRPDPEAIGDRIARARERAGQTITQLAHAIGLDRSALSRIESGQRHLRATEAVDIAETLQIPLTLLVYPPLRSVVSRRTDTAPSHESTFALDDMVEVFARDVHTLLRDDVVRPADPRRWRPPSDTDAAERMAGQVREHLRIGSDPIPDIAAVAERFGMVTFSAPLRDKGAAGAMVEVAAGVAAAVIDGDSRLGRRRFTVAHELGHWLTGDAYDSAPADIEELLQTFAAHLIAPRSGVVKLRSSGQSPREFAIRVAGGFRMSWSATVRHLRNSSLLTDIEHRQLLDMSPPPRGDLVLATGATDSYFTELEATTVSPGLRTALLRGYRDRRVSAGVVTRLLDMPEDDLPTRREEDPPTLDVLGPRREVIDLPELFPK